MHSPGPWKIGDPVLEALKTMVDLPCIKQAVEDAEVAIAEAEGK